MSTDYKKIFGQKDIILTQVDRDTIASEAESVKYMLEYFNKKERFIPPVDFNKPKYFARFGSAEKYYIDSIERIYKTYPYDGSLKERIQWELSSSYLDLHLFENEYPRTNGYVNFVGAPGTTENSGGFYPPAGDDEYILVFGGPNTSTRGKSKDIKDTSGDYKSGYANVWDLPKNRENNLLIDGSPGNTVEFWLKKEAYVSDQDYFEVIFDAHVTGTVRDDTDYGRFTVMLATTGTVGNSAYQPFVVRYGSGSNNITSYLGSTTLTTASIADGKWHHYAIRVITSGSDTVSDLYVDGACNDTAVYSGKTVDYVSGNIVATIGALASSFNVSDIESGSRGWAKLSGSLDEFRFWKTQRTSQQIGRQMIEPVGGGTNTDDANTTLGVYYKFNEGITLTASTDQIILDYSGRISNGTFEGYSSDSRNTGSAMVASGKVNKEFKDPILYSFHPDVLSLKETRQGEGRIYDYSNNASIYHSLPTWIIEEDEAKEHSPLRNLTQIIGSYFDTLASQIESIPKFKHKNYLSSSFKPYPFADRLLESVGFSYFPELFSDATALQHFRNRDDVSLFKQKLYDVKNRIYQNIYNNIVYIYKTKGTEKSFRNLIRCFGLDNEVYKINTYGNRITYQLKDNYESVAEFKKYANFSLVTTKNAVVFPFSSSTNPNSTSFISASLGDALETTGGLALTMETEVAFPRRHSLAASNTVAQVGTGSSKSFRAFSPFRTASLFGMHQVEGTAENNLTWASTDYANFQVYAIRDTEFSKRCQFVLTGTADSVIPTLSSSYFNGVFDDTRWNFSVAIKPTKYPETTLPSGSSGSTWDVEFYGIEKVLDVIKNEFFVTSSITTMQGTRFMTNPKSIYIGAHRTNFSGGLLQSSDGNISSTRVWMTYLPTGAIKQHAQDVKNYGTPNPYKSAYLYQTTMAGTRIPEIHTLALNWEFSTLTASDASGEFVGQDFSSGSTSLRNRYNWIGNIIGKQYLPKGYAFPTNSSSSINRKYIYSAKKQLPEMINSSDMVNVLEDDDKFFNKVNLARPTNYYMYIEKSMYQTISEEMIKIFSSIKDFNNLIGEPVNKYRDNYKHMEKLRSLFFERVSNTADLDKYIDFYKWVDQTLDSLLGYLVPASADISDQYGSNIRTLVESHVLERNKYKWQYPTLEDKTPSAIEGHVLGINELTYNWEFGHAPLQQFSNNKSIAFNGTNGQSQLTVSDAANLSFGADGTTGNEPSFSWSAWVKPTDLDKPFIVASKILTGGSGDEYCFGHIPLAGLVFLIADGDGFGGDYIAQAGVTLTEGVWQHVCGTYNGNRGPTGIKLYLNGALQSSTGLSPGTYAAMSNSSADLVIGRRWSGLTTNVAEGFMDEIAAFNKELSSAEVSELYKTAQTFNLNDFSAAANLVSWWRMGDKATGTSPNYTIPDQIGSNRGAMASFQGDSTSGVVSDAPAAFLSTAEKCLWWNQRAERTNPVITSRDSNVDSDKQTMLDSINNETNASDYTLYDNANSAAYSGSTYAIRRLAKPYKFDVRDTRAIKGGINFHPNKKVTYYKESMKRFNTLLNNENIIITELYNLPNCPTNLSGSNKVIKFPMEANNWRENSNSTIPDSFSDAPGSLLAPFNIVSSSVGPQTGLNDLRSLATLTNIHHDVYGPDYEHPIQGPFTEKHVGGNQHRHHLVNTGSDQHSNRPEAFSIDQEGGAWSTDGVTLVSPLRSAADGTTSNPDANLPRAVFFREPMAKRPVNIRNIQQATGSRILGNYSKDYEILMTSGRSINNRYFVKNEGVSGSATDILAVSGVLDYNLPGGGKSAVDRTQVVKNGVTSSVRNDYIIVNRFSAPGDPSTMGLGFLDIESQEYSIYNALPWRNLIVRESLHELFIDHTKQFGFFSDAQNSASYVLAGETYPGTSGSVSTANYDGTASFHKINKNRRRVVKFNGTGDKAPVVTGAVYDNWYIQHQIPQTDLQYAWITSSIINDYTGSALFGFEQPNFDNASLASTDITFCSASDMVSFFYIGDGNRYYGAPQNSAVATKQQLPVDFVGLNTNLQEVISSSTNILGYPSLIATAVTANNYTINYGNSSYIYRYWDDGTTPGLSSILNSLILHRQGPYGWPSWKQIRGGEHPIIRAHRKENRLSFAKNISIDGPPPFDPTELGIHIFREFGGKNRDIIVSQIEPPLSSKFKPITHNLQIKTGWGETPNTNKIKVRHSYGNEKTNFPQKVSGSIDLDKVDYIYVPTGQAGQLISDHPKTLIYDSLHNFITKPSTANPIEEFINLQIEETIYPREHYTYLKSTRQRNNFANSFWRDTRNARNTDLSTIAATTSSQNHVVSQSMWPLDGRSDTSATALTSSYGIEGELQNGYSLFFSPTDINADFRSPMPAATYARRIPESHSNDNANVIFAGDTAWEAATQAGVNPFYNDYASYVEELKRIGKDYGVVPEYRISEQMNYLWTQIKDGSGDFDNPPTSTAYLTLTGSTLSSSDDKTFYTVYTYSDFMKHFKEVQDDSLQYGAVPTELTLECEALIKFLPYDGFYPAQRTVQLAGLFSQSYGPTAELSGDDANWRTAMAPLFSPGILYNSVKSGIAVDYPIATGSVGHNLFITGAMPAGGFTADTRDDGDPRLSGTFDYRVPFEALIDPLDANFNQVIDTEPHPSASIDSTASFNSAHTPLYGYAINNFLAEVPSFFLKNGALTSLTSGKDINTITATPNTDYKMRIVCNNGIRWTKEQLTDHPGPLSSSRHTQTASFIYNRPQTVMYNRSFSTSSGEDFTLRHVGKKSRTISYGSSFGPPCDAPYRDGPTLLSESHFDAFTPPYYNGYSHVELTFRSGMDGKMNISDIKGALTPSQISVFRETTRESGSGEGTCAGRSAMSITASLNWGQVVSTDDPISGEPGTGGDKWVIQPKWECPILDFNSSSITLPTYGSGSVAKGMWHQYSSVVPENMNSIYMSVQDVPGHPEEQSLRKLLGFNATNSWASLGRPAEKKTISEAVVAIPFWPDTNAVTTGGKNYFNIDINTIHWAEQLINVKKGGFVGKKAEAELMSSWYLDGQINPEVLEFKPAKSVTDMVKTMKKYVIPPQFDFLRPGAQIDPFAMFIFEFETTLTRNDLINIWQNLPPNDPNNPSINNKSLSRAVTKRATAPFSWPNKKGLNLLKRKDLLQEAKNNNDGNWKGYDLLNERPAEGTTDDINSPLPDPGDNTNLPFPSEVQWLVFKVKQKAKTNYYNLTATVDSEDSNIPYYSFNWPYDFFSLVEMIKINAAYKLENDPTSPYKLAPPLNASATDEENIMNSDDEAGIPFEPFAPGSQEASNNAATTAGTTPTPRPLGTVSEFNVNQVAARPTGANIAAPAANIGASAVNPRSANINIGKGTRNRKDKTGPKGGRS